MKRFSKWFLMLAVILAAVSFSAAKADAYGTLNQKMATRTGPSTKYDEPGTFFNGKWKGQRVRVISKVNTGVWWLQVEFTYNGQLMRAYTGLKRVDNVNLNSVPTESVIGTCRLSRSVKGYYGPGSNYKPMGYAVPANTTCDVIMTENGYVLVEFPYHYKNYEKSRAWVPASQVSGNWSRPGYDTGSYVRDGVSWWTQEPQWSSCTLTYTAPNTMSIELFFYRIAGIYGTVTVDGSTPNHGWLTAWFDYAPRNVITGEVWFTKGGLRIEMDAYRVDQKNNGGYSSFYPDTVFYYQYR